MALTSVDSGSQSASISTEHTLSTQASAGVYVLEVDMNALVNGDVVELRCYVKTKSGSTSRQAYVQSYANVQENPVAISVPVPTDTEFKATLLQTAGTGRSFDWNVLKL